MARIYSLNEVKNLPTGTDVWGEIHGWDIYAYTISGKLNDSIRLNNAVFNYIRYNKDNNGWGWRLWDSRPSADEVKNAKWDEVIR